MFLTRCPSLQYVRKRKNYFAHDETEQCHDGDVVMIRESQSYSKRKHFVVQEVLERAQSYTDPATGNTLYQTKT